MYNRPGAERSGSRSGNDPLNGYQNNDDDAAFALINVLCEAIIVMNKKNSGILPRADIKIPDKYYLSPS